MQYKIKLYFKDPALSNITQKRLKRFQYVKKYKLQLKTIFIIKIKLIITENKLL